MTAPTYDRCVRCGYPTPQGRTTCRGCNPAGLPEPSRSQYHASVFVVVIVVLAVLAAVGMGLFRG
ncbi:MAG TPA: hypothetical protein VH561_10185 [Micromonosporaceae bacterium]|jgi:hypothetical protein